MQSAKWAAEVAVGLLGSSPSARCVWFTKLARRVRIHLAARGGISLPFSSMP
jgi:hypothetical protein